jgi:large subunit ribosomal protein L5
MDNLNYKKQIKDFLEKIVINVGIGKMAVSSANFEEKILPQIMKELAIITGQFPQKTKARQSIAGFKLRQGQIVGLKVTLRGNKMVDFFERLVKIVLPRVKDFRGVDKEKIDEGGSLNLGFREQYVFPEINQEESIVTFPLGINIIPKHKNKKVAEQKYLELGFPFKKNK